jgi:hypothetical protein
MVYVYYTNKDYNNEEVKYWILKESDAIAQTDFNYQSTKRSGVSLHIVFNNGYYILVKCDLESKRHFPNTAYIHVHSIPLDGKLIQSPKYDEEED